jgi:phosphoglycerate dehydrogenase-like enzyme
MAWKVLITARTFEVVGKPAIEFLKSKGCEVTIPPKWGPLSGSELLEQLSGHDAVLCSPDAYNADVFASIEGSNLKIISRWGVGYDSINVPDATAAGIPVAYTPGLLDEAVADYAFALLLTMARRTHSVHQTMREGGWAVEWGVDLGQKTLGIIGCGRIGRAVAKRASGFDMRVLGYDVMPHPDAKAMGVDFVDLDTLLKESDFVSIHAALTEENKGMIGTEQLKSMKQEALLVNTARGAHVDEAALVQALKEGWIAGAALDAYIKEPLPADHPFRTTPNLLMSPHQASSSKETGERVSLAAAEAIVDLMEGRRPKLLVNAGVLDQPQLRAQLK